MGDRLGLYEALRDGSAVTSSELAATTGIAERYAREWLEQQAAIGYLTVDDTAADPSSAPLRAARRPRRRPGRP